MSPRRDPTLPDVPAVAETSPGFGLYAWVMFVAPGRGHRLKPLQRG